MNRRIFVKLALTLAVTALAMTSFGSISVDALCLCPAFPDQYAEQTQMRWGIASNCSASEANLWSQASADIDAVEDCETKFDLCSNLVITADCHWDASHQAYVTDGYGVWECRRDDCGPLVP